MKPPSNTLQEILRIVFDEPITWLGEEPGETIPIHWAVTSPAEAQPGDLLVIKGSEWDAKIHSQARRNGIAAVLLVGEIPPNASLPNPSFPVLHLRSESDERQVSRRIISALLSRQSVLLQRGARLNARFLQLVAEGEGLQSLVSAIAEVSGCGTIVQDKRGQVLAQQASPALFSIWEVVLEQLGSLDSLPKTLLDRKRAGIQAGLVTQEIPGSLVRLVCPITVSQVVRGYLSLVSMDGELDDLDHLVAEQGALVCAIEMARKKAIRETEKRLKGDLLTALLQENLSSRDAELWVQAMGMDLNQAHAALRFVWEGENPPSRRRLETIVNGEIASLGYKVIVNPFGLEVICFCQVPPEVRRPEPALALAQAVIDQARSEYPQHPMRCGVGTPVRELSEWGGSFRQAGQALAMARRFGGGKPLYFPDLSVYRLLLQIEHNPELITFQEETLGKLMAHEHAAEFIHTLEAYFEHKGNISQTAEALFIHRNTLIYRMERIASILDLDLDDPENRLALQLALRIQRMQGAQ